MVRTSLDLVQRLNWRQMGRWRECLQPANGLPYETILKAYKSFKEEL